MQRSELKLYSEHLQDIQQIPDLAEKFRKLCVYYSELVTKAGYPVSPYRSPDLRYFSALPEDKQREAIADLQTTVEIFEETQAEGYSLANSPKLLWRGLAKFGWVPQSDIFDKIGSDDLFQVYSKTNKLLLANLDLYRWLTFTMEEVYCGHWFTLIKRPSEITMKLYETAMKVLTGELSSTFSPDIPEHLCEEVDSPGHARFHLAVKFVSPLKKDGEIAGFIAVCRGRPL